MNLKVAQTFRELYLGKRTGALIAESGEVKRGIFFRSGFVVRARSSRPEDRLGEVMIRHGRITAEQFRDASHFIKSGWRLGEILAELKLIDRAEIEQFVRQQILEVACSVLIEPPRRLAFSNLAEVEGVVSVPVSVADVLMEAARRTPEIGKHRDRLLADGRRLGFATDPLLRFQDIRLEPEEAYVLSRIDGTATAREIFALSSLDDERTARALLGLLEAGVLAPEGEANGVAAAAVRTAPPPCEGPAPAGASEMETRRREVERLYEELQTADHWSVLGLERGAGREAIQAAFIERARRFHPDRFRSVEDPELEEKVSFVFQRISEAKETLLSAAAAADYEKLAEKDEQYDARRREWSKGPGAAPTESERTRHPSEARALFARAKRAYEAKDYWSAIQYCQQAIEIVGDDASYYHLLGLALARNPRWRKDAEQNLKIAANLDPWNAAYLVDLGRLYRRAGLRTRAERTFEQARAIDPTIEIEDGEE